MIRRTDWPAVAVWLTSSMVFASAGVRFDTHKQHPPSTCEILPPNCSASTPKGFIWSGTSHCDVEQDGRVWNTCDYILPRTH